MFQVRSNINAKVIHTVYAVRGSEDLIEFLFFDGTIGKWIWRYSSDFVPCFDLPEE